MLYVFLVNVGFKNASDKENKLTIVNFNKTSQNIPLTSIVG
jgi:hypothetical protein